MLSSLVARFAADGIEARAVIAGTPGAAHAVARFGTLSESVAVVAAQSEAVALAPLPIEALRLPPSVCHDLRLVGLTDVGALLGMPRAPLARRYGAQVALRLDQAVGVVCEPIRPLPPARPMASRLGFVEPLSTAEAFATVIERLVDDVCKPDGNGGTGRAPARARVRAGRRDGADGAGGDRAAGARPRPSRPAAGRADRDGRSGAGRGSDVAFGQDGGTARCGAGERAGGGGRVCRNGWRRWSTR